MPVIDLRDNPFSSMSAHLLDLLHALEGNDVPLILVGGFGLYLRRRFVEAEGSRTLYSPLPETRATEDFDFAIKLELLADSGKMRAQREALNDLGYQVFPKAEEYQFVKPGTGDASHRDVKIDLLARQPGPNDPKLHFGDRRVMPKKATIRCTRSARRRPSLSKTVSGRSQLQPFVRQVMPARVNCCFLTPTRSI